MLCHSPQERLFIDGGWHDGLLPPVEALPAAERATTLAEYRAFGAAVAAAGDDGAFAIPTARSRWSDSLAALDRITFAAWLDARGLAAPALRWYLDYCCRDDYGAGSGDVSAWAGLHYFASRHGFRAPGDEARGADGSEGRADLARGQCLARRTARRAARRAPAARARRPRRRRRPPRGRASTPGTPRRGSASAGSRRASSSPRRSSSRRGCSPRRRRRCSEASAPRSPCALAGRQPAARRRPRRSARRAAVVGQRRLRRAAASATSTRCTRARGRSPAATVLTAYVALGGGGDAALAEQRRRLLGDDWRTLERARHRRPRAGASRPRRQGAPRRPDALRPCDEHSRARRAQQRGAARARRAAAPGPLRARRPVGVLGLRGSASSTARAPAGAAGSDRPRPPAADRRPQRRRASARPGRGGYDAAPATSSSAALGPP